MATASILRRELTPHSFVFPQVPATDRRALLGNYLFEQSLIDGLIFIRTILDGGIEHLSCRRSHYVTYVAAVVPLCQLRQSADVNPLIRGKFGECQREQAFFSATGLCSASFAWVVFCSVIGCPPHMRRNQSFSASDVCIFSILHCFVLLL